MELVAEQLSSDDRDRFWSKVNFSGKGCWTWTGIFQNKGYGDFEARPEPKKRVRALAHRLSYRLNRGPIPEGLRVLHTCDNPACVNPEHLFLGDQQANVSDMKAKGRMAVGTRLPQSKLKEGDIQEIFKMRSGGASQDELAEKFGVGQYQISRILSGKRWAHVTREV